MTVSQLCQTLGDGDSSLCSRPLRWWLSVCRVSSCAWVIWEPRNKKMWANVSPPHTAADNLLEQLLWKCTCYYVFKEKFYFFFQNFLWVRVERQYKKQFRSQSRVILNAWLLQANILYFGKQFQKHYSKPSLLMWLDNRSAGNIKVLKLFYGDALPEIRTSAAKCKRNVIK